MSLATLLKEHPFLELTPKNRIKCNILGHEMPPTFHAVNTYVGSKKLKKAQELHNYDFTIYEPYIIVNKKNSNMLYCNVTHVTINKHPDKIKLHMNGRQFLTKKAEFDAELKNKEKNQKKEKKIDKKLKKKILKTEIVISESESDEKPDFWIPPEELEQESDVEENDNDDASVDDLELDSDIEENQKEEEEEEHQHQHHSKSLNNKLLQKLVDAQPTKTYKRKLEHREEEPTAVVSKSKKSKSKKVSDIKGKKKKY